MFKILNISEYLTFQTGRAGRFDFIKHGRAKGDRSFATEETMMINFSTDSGNKYIVCDVFQKNMEYNQQQYLSKIKIQREESKH